MIDPVFGYIDDATYRKAAAFCAYQERSQQEVRDKLYTLKVQRDDIENIIAKLVQENFINEERFAIQLTNGKFRIKHWGKVKITQALKFHKITPYCIKKALQQIPDDDYIRSLNQVIEKKRNTIPGKLTPLKARKLAHFVQSKGYESELIWKILKAQEKIEL